jgi:hypothetical protein
MKDLSLRMLFFCPQTALYVSPTLTQLTQIYPTVPAFNSTSDFTNQEHILSLQGSVCIKISTHASKMSFFMLPFLTSIIPTHHMIQTQLDFTTVKMNT